MIFYTIHEQTDVSVVMLRQVADRLKRHQPRIINAPIPKAAVLIPVTDQEYPEIIFTRRSSHMTTHSGEVAFPGGKQDESDDSLQSTALRESFEEIGLPSDKVQIIGQCGAVISRFGIEVTPFVGILPFDTPLKANVAELDRIFRVPVHLFLDKKQWRFDTWHFNNRDYQMPAFQYGEYLIWGLTAIMLVEFLNTTCDAGIPLEAPQFTDHYLKQYS